MNKNREFNQLNDRTKKMYYYLEPKVTEIIKEHQDNNIDIEYYVIDAYKKDHEYQELIESTDYPVYPDTCFEYTHLASCLLYYVDQCTGKRCGVFINSDCEGSEDDHKFNILDMLKDFSDEQ